MGRDLVYLLHSVYTVYTLGCSPHCIGPWQICARQRFAERTPDPRDRKNGASPGSASLGVSHALEMLSFILWKRGQGTR